MCALATLLHALSPITGIVAHNRWRYGRLSHITEARSTECSDWRLAKGEQRVRPRGWRLLSESSYCLHNPSFRNQSPRFCLWTQGRVVREAGSCQSRTCGAPVLCGAIHTCWGKPGREGPEPRGAHQVAHAAAGVSRVRSAQGCWHECSPGLPGGKQTKTPIFLFPIRRGYRKERSYCSISHSTTFDFH
jgi:hypothetical protein